MPYRIAGIDVHKRMLAVVVADVEVDGEYAFERRQYGSNPAQLRLQLVACPEEAGRLSARIRQIRSREGRALFRETEAGPSG